jgi:hypothetical protein
MTKTVIVPMEIRKLTKGAVQYREVGTEDNPKYLIGTLYLRKTGMDYEKLSQLGLSGVQRSPEYPAHIKVTIEVIEDGSPLFGG